MKTKVLLFACLLLIAAGCKKEDMDIDQLPPITQEGLNTFGCLINGKVHVPKNGKSSGLFTGGSGAKGLTILFGPNFTADGGGDFIGISAANREKSGVPYLYLYIDMVTIKDEFIVGLSNGKHGRQSPPNPHAYFFNDDAEGNRITYLSLPNSGKINLHKLDFGNSIVSGTFELKALNRDDYLDTLYITQGRFDINWRTLNKD